MRYARSNSRSAESNSPTGGFHFLIKKISQVHIIVGLAFVLPENFVCGYLYACRCIPDPLAQIFA